MAVDKTETWNHPPDRTKTYSKRMDDIPRPQTVAPKRHAAVLWIIAHVKLWPPQRHAAVLWILAHFVFYRLQNNRRLSLRDYVAFMKRARWKLQQYIARPKTGRYLEVLE
jgi:hypothetical protein